MSSEYLTPAAWRWLGGRDLGEQAGKQPPAKQRRQGQRQDEIEIVRDSAYAKQRRRRMQARSIRHGKRGH